MGSVPRTREESIVENTPSRHANFVRVAGLLAATSLLVPLVGLATAPILAHGLGVAGRGEVAAAVAPNVLLAGVATLGLPDALTYYLAASPSRSRRVLIRAGSLSVLLGVVAFLVVMALARVLGAGVPGLADLILLATGFAVPQLCVNLLRGAAIGRHMWRAVAAERVVGSMLRLLLLTLLFITGSMTVLSAVLVTVLAPLIAGAAYWRLAAPVPALEEPAPARTATTRNLVQYGSRIWLGSIASIVMSRLGPLLVTPLSDVRQLGLLTVAVTVADVPFIVATSVRDALFGADSRSPDADRLGATTRLATAVAATGSLVLGISLPWWIEVAFGAGFRDAIVPTWILLASSVASVPGWMAGSGLSAWGRPALRSAGLVAALAVNVVGLILLVPVYGATGAALAALLGGVTLSLVTVLATRSTVGISSSALLVLRRSDLRAIAGLRRRG